jgi:hypothetical protein
MVTARRHVVAWMAGLLTVLIMVAPSAAMAGSPDGQFADPPSSKRPKFFWNWPGNLVENGELAREVGEMSDVGFGGGLVLPLLYGVPATPGFARFRVRSETQPHGLLGPVRLVPYAERTVGSR